MRQRRYHYAKPPLIGKGGVSPSHAHSSEAFRYSTLLSIPLLGLARRPWFATLSVGQAAQKYSLVQGSEANSWRWRSAWLEHIK